MPRDGEKLRLQFPSLNIYFAGESYWAELLRYEVARSRRKIENHDFLRHDESSFIDDFLYEFWGVNLF